MEAAQERSEQRSFQQALSDNCTPDAEAVTTCDFCTRGLQDIHTNTAVVRALLEDLMTILPINLPINATKIIPSTYPVDTTGLSGRRFACHTKI